jgi:hypothetical protein
MREASSASPVMMMAPVGAAKLVEGRRGVGLAWVTAYRCGDGGERG